MRYFKYKNTNQNRNNALKEQYKTLNEKEQRAVRKEKRWRKLSTILPTVAFFLFVIVGIDLIVSIPLPNGWLLESLVIVGKVLLGFVLIIVSGLAACIVAIPLWKKEESFQLPPMKKEILSKACSHLRDYYELQEPYIVTKCFDSSDEIFRNHDVCIFVAHDELRITTDLMRGFLCGERDLGCYAFNRDEITLLKRQNGKYLIAELKANDVVFLLGYRAKGFIEKNFTAKQSN